MMAKDKGVGQRRRTTAKDDARGSGRWKNSICDGRRTKGRCVRAAILDLRRSRGVGPLEVSKNGMDEKRFETTYLSFSRGRLVIRVLGMELMATDDADTKATGARGGDGG